MSVDMKVPEIRFLGFSGEWVEENLGAVAEVKTGPFGSTLHAEDYVEDGHAIITTEHFKSGELPVEKKGIPQVSKYDYLRLKAYLLKVGDIVFSRVGSVDINAHVTNKQKGWLFSGRVLRVRSKKSIDSEYLHHELSTSRVKKSVISRAVGQTMPSINTEILKITPINFPVDTTEQAQIGNTFQKLDSLINQHQQKHDKLSSIKKAMLVKMFPKQGETTPEIRFKGFSGEWEENTLGDYTMFRRGSFPQPYGNKEWYGGEGSMPFVQVVDVSKKLSLVENTKQKISLKAQPLSVFAPKGSVVVTLQGTIGRVALTQYDSFFDRTILIFQSFSKNTDSSFWAYTIQNKFDLEKQRAPGGTIKTITKDALSSFEVLIPSIEEQTQIGNCFQKLDALINQHQQQITKLNNIKQACLSKMFV